MRIENAKDFTNPPLSYWIASTSNTDYPPLDKDINVDVAIVGGGITGISCAYQLQQTGLQTAVLEADRIVKGTTGHTTAKITSQHDLIYDKIVRFLGEELGKQYAEANENAIREIKRIIDLHSIDCDFLSQSAYVFTQDDKYLQKIHDEAKTASRLGIEANYVENIPLPLEVKGALRFDNQAQFHPRKYALALAKAISHKNCAIYEQSRVVDIEEGVNYILTTEQGKKITAQKVIIASHYPFYNKSGLYFARLYTERSYALAIQAEEQYPGGMYINAEDPTRSLRSQNSEQGELIIVGGEHHKTGQGIDTVKHYENLVDFATKIFTVQDLPYRWSTQDCMTLDDLPYVGLFSPDTPHLYIATGFGKWGMTNSTVSALLLKDLIVKGESPWQDVYNPARQNIIASAKNFVVQNLNVAKELLSGKLTPLPEDLEIEKGEGKVFEIEGEKTGVFKDEKGVLHQVNTTCTHMGCELNWNSAERSWDCPCHGSRFSYQGKVIEGPALKPLTTNKNVNTLEKVITEDF
ncbi:MAG: FAD-dependent oxidoreductase [Desulfitobacteriia bacterium]|jgi:glycine/D-amino acid oxidase-like deaminating enzyme/nitrite reductase/ring-hydroxylating ferredoxin subunit